MKNILVPTDFSPVSLNATRYACDMAAFLGAQLTVLHVYTPPTITMNEVPLPPIEFDKGLKDIDDRMKAMKTELAGRSLGKIDIITETRIGNIRTEINVFAKSIDPLVVVMASHGAGTVERLLLGSNTLWATKHLHWPLVIVPKDAVFRKFSKIGLAWNFRPVKETACLEKTRKLVRDFGAELHVIYVMKSAEEEHSEKLKAAQARFHEVFGDLHPRYSFLVNENITEALLKYTEENALDLVIIVPARHDLLDSLFHHSQSRDMTIHAKWPLLSLHE
jgi:nucleotide-binding universal stress UspA family protein